jgi:aconitate hydratase
VSGINLARQLIAAHRLDGAGPEPRTGEELALRIDQTLTQDATGTLVMLELEALGLDRVRTQCSVQYVDHNLLQADFRNADDHLFLRSACRRFGLWYSGPGEGISHPVHQQRFGRPGRTLLGSDSHTCAAGALGMLAIGAGGLEVALAMAGEPFYLRMPEIWGVRLHGRLPEWVSAKDVILELLRRHGVRGGLGRIVEYHGPGLASLGAMDRHVIANMGAELGATSSVFPADETVRAFLEREGRGADYEPWQAEPGASYDVEEEIDLGALEPLIALPSSPGRVCRVRELAGQPIYQAYLGSSANPGFRDFAIAAELLSGRQVAPGVSFDVNPTSRELLGDLIDAGHIGTLLRAGARLHQPGCNGCIGMGQAPATGRISLRTVPRNFPGRSGTREDRVHLVSPETAAASALRGVITDPRELGIAYPRVGEPVAPRRGGAAIEPPLPPEQARAVVLEKGPGIASLPQLEPLPERLELPVLLELGDDISTDEILPAGARALPFRSNIGQLQRFAFEGLAPDYAQRSACWPGHALVAGRNYGQGSSREHAALVPRSLGLRAVLAIGFARIHWQNLVSFGVLPLRFEDPDARERVRVGDTLVLEDLRASLAGGRLEVRVQASGESFAVRCECSPRQLEVLAAGGLIRWLAARLPAPALRLSAPS